MAVLSVCLFVILSVTLMRPVILFSPFSDHIIILSYTRHCSEIPMGHLFRDIKCRKRCEKVAIFDQLLAIAQK